MLNLFEHLKEQIAERRSQWRATMFLQALRLRVKPAMTCQRTVSFRRKSESPCRWCLAVNA